MPKTKRRKRTKWTKRQLDVLYECWKNAETNKERIELVEEKLPKIPPLAALNKMRSMAKTDSKWIGMATRRKNQKEKEKLQIELEKKRKRKERERKQEEKEKRRVLREQKRKEKEKTKAEKTLKEKIKSKLKRTDVEVVEGKVEGKIFFCPKVQQFMNNVSCIFRTYSDDYGFSVGGPCEKCTKMDEYIPILQEVIKNARKKRTERNKTSKRGGKDKTEEKTRRASKTRKTTSGPKHTRRKQSGRVTSTNR